MSAAVTWVVAPQTEVGGSARPDYVVGPGGEGNSVAVITLTNRHHGERVAIEGRPEHLLEIAREILRTAEQIVEVTMRDPGLRSLYGLTTEIAGRVIEVPLPDSPIVRKFLARERAMGKSDNQIVLDMMNKVMPQSGAVDDAS